jgi:hypothetical protein
MTHDVSPVDGVLDGMDMRRLEVQWRLPANVEVVPSNDGFVPRPPRRRRKIPGIELGFPP